ncbi:MAG: hypothetical protein ACYDEX_25845, partial [Mobilitalea sp.]
MKKLLSIVLSLCFLTMLLTGCGKASDDTTDTAAPDKTESDTDAVDATEAPTESDKLEPVTLKWYLHGSNVPMI